MIQFLNNISVDAYLVIDEAHYMKQINGSWAKAVLNISEYAMQNSIGGFEFLSCIPGTVGGGIRMNSGCFGTEFKDILLSVQAVDREGKVLTIPSSGIKFEYRKNDLPEDLIFLNVPKYLGI